jgi:hypothetical protein
LTLPVRAKKIAVISPYVNRRSLLSVTMVAFFLATVVVAQRGRRWRYDSQYLDRGTVPTWEIDKEFKEDVFTFVRIKYESGHGFGRQRGGWFIDYPDSDLNFSLRLQQLTSLKVNPDPVVLELTDDRLFDYPFVYIIEPGSLMFSEQEVVALRRYCFNGGFVMVDDFWGDAQYENLRRELKRVFPSRDPFEVPLSHEIFHCVYDMKEKPMVPAIGAVYRMRNGRYASAERSWDGSDTQTPHYRAITDDADRIMVFICHNTDLGDGWEEEARDPEYFKEFSVKLAYPMGINIVTYAMTH